MIPAAISAPIATNRSVRMRGRAAHRALMQPSKAYNGFTGDPAVGRLDVQRPDH